MSTAALNNLATYILSLGLSRRSREWLAGKSLEPQAPKVKMTEEEFYGKIEKSVASAEIGNVYTKRENESVEDFVNRLLCTD